MGKILDAIREPADLRRLGPDELSNLALEIRALILETVAKNGGHLASNLGAVELTMALHLAFDAPRDKIVWDVGHQCYTHKILTGRKDRFAGLRRCGGLLGFPCREESEYDAYNTGPRLDGAVGRPGHGRGPGQARRERTTSSPSSGTAA